MGAFSVTIEIGDPQGQHFEPVDALVDTGASYTVVPRSLLARLDVTPYVRDTFVLADGRRAELDIGQTWVRVDARSVVTLVVFGDEGIEPLLGAYTLEGLRLAPDPVSRQLIPVPGRLMALPSLPAFGSWSSSVKNSPPF
jgi:clan AA aspartic protease